jgi:hypothetical protein
LNSGVRLAAPAGSDPRTKFNVLREVKSSEPDRFFFLHVLEVLLPLREGRKREAFSGRGMTQASEIGPSPKFASLRFAKCRLSLKGRVGS